MKTDQKYGVIIADPPWSYRVDKDTPYHHGAANDQYQTMADSDINDLELAPGVRVPDVADKNSVLLMWCTWPKMVEGMDVIRAWGFEYITGMPWVKTASEVNNPLVPQPNMFGAPDWTFKPSYGVGFWLRGVTEPILIAKKGKPDIVDVRKAGVCGIMCERMDHSRKPDKLHDYAELMPGPYLELFARRPREGWDVWGNDSAIQS